MTETTVNALLRVQQRIRNAERTAGRSTGSVRLVAVSKTFPASSIQELRQAGQTAFGENYAQEFLEKAVELNHIDIEWHFIGSLQSNKTRSIAEYSHWVHTVDRKKIAQRLSDQRPANLSPLNVCIQVNVSEEPGKMGCTLRQATELAYQLIDLPKLRLRGLMCIPERTTDTARLAHQFAQLRGLFDKLNSNNFQLDTLSMGMSSDLELAIAEGATLVRVGTALFGERQAV